MEAKALCDNDNGNLPPFLKRGEGMSEAALVFYG